MGTPLNPWSGRPPREFERIDEILDELRTCWVDHPDMRLGQLVENLCSVEPASTFYVEDDKILTNLKIVNARSRLNQIDGFKWLSKKYET